jgi:hypothetical protein
MSPFSNAFETRQLPRAQRQGCSAPERLLLLLFLTILASEEGTGMGNVSHLTDEVDQIRFRYLTPHRRFFKSRCLCWKFQQAELPEAFSIGFHLIHLIRIGHRWSQV